MSWLSAAFGAAVDDVRRRVVEEPWFGRPVTGRSDHSSPAASLAEQFGWDRAGDQSPARPVHDQGHDLDR